MKVFFTPQLNFTHLKRSFCSKQNDMAFFVLFLSFFIKSFTVSRRVKISPSNFLCRVDGSKTEKSVNETLDDCEAKQEG